MLTGVALIDAIKRRRSDDFAWRKPPYEYEHDKEPIDILAGSPALRAAIDAGERAEELVPVWERESKPFEEVRAEYLCSTTSRWPTDAKVLDVTRTQSDPGAAGAGDAGVLRPTPISRAGGR